MFRSKKKSQSEQALVATKTKVKETVQINLVVAAYLI
jgi:hypothetical protein